MPVARRQWTVDRAGRTYHVDMADEYFLGERVVRVDGHVAYRGRTMLSDHSGIYEFDLGSAPAFFEIKTNGLRYFYDLIVDGISMNSGTRVDDTPVAIPTSTANAIVGFVATLGLVAAFVVLAGPRLWADARIAVDGVTTDAQVTSKTIAGPKSDHIIGYSFDTTTGTFVGQMFVSDDEYLKLHVGDRVRVAYLRSDPSVNQRPLDVVSYIVLLGVVALFIGLPVSQALAVAGAVRDSRTRRGLAARGQETRGQITAIGSVRGRYATVLGCRFGYTYADQNGVEHRGWSGGYKFPALYRWPIGTAVRVRYDPEHPAESSFLG